MCCDELANEHDVVVGDHTVAVAQRSLHVSQRSRTGRGTQGLNANYLLGDNHDVIHRLRRPNANWSPWPGNAETHSKQLVMAVVGPQPPNTAE